MDLPSLRHFRNDGIYYISSDPVEALHGEAWINAVYTDKGWATADGSKLLTGVEEWRYAIEEGQVSNCDLGKHSQGDQSRQTTQANNSNRVRKSRQKTQKED
jgi:hypothetical protein